MAGRTQFKYSRLYLNNINVSCYAQSFGPLVWEFGEIDATAPMCDEAKGYFPDIASVTPTVVNGIMDNSAASLFTALPDAGVSHTFTAAIGSRAAPVQGDPVFCGRFQRSSSSHGDSGGLTLFNINFDQWDSDYIIKYNKPWGVLLSPNTFYTSPNVNTSTGVDDYGAATALGGYMIYHVLTVDGTATLKVQDAATNVDGSFADLSGATTGLTDWLTATNYGIVALGQTATVRRYLRYQIVWGTATYFRVVLSFVRRTSLQH